MNRTRLALIPHRQPKRHTVLATLMLVGALAGPAGAEVLNLADVNVGSGGFAIEGAASGDFAGQSVAAAGDFNGDGLADMIVGAREAGGTGRAFVVFGKTNTTQVNLASPGAAFLQINGQTAGDDAGASVSGAGDVNGDGLADVVVGAPYNSTNNGRVYVVFGKTNTTTVELTAVATGVGGFAVTSASTDRFGFAVAGVGDVNGDGLADIAASLPFAASGGTQRGQVLVVFGRTATTPLTVAGVAGGVGGFVMNGEVDNQRTGEGLLGGGDVNGDGLADVLVGAQRFNGIAGRGYIVFGKSSGTAVNLTDVASGTGGLVLNGEAASDNAGASMAAVGDMNGDARAEVLVGAWGADAVTPGSTTGRAYTFFGTSVTAAVNLSAVAGGAGGFVLNGEPSSGRLGRSLSSAGDVDGDGLGDLIVGAYQQNVSAGRVYVLPGRPNTEAVAATTIAAGLSGRAFLGESASTAGRSVAGVGDVNGDGYPDFVIGAPIINTNTGRAYVVHGTPQTAAAGAYRSFLRSGAVTALVGTGDVQSGSYPPDSRVAIGYNAGTTASTETATLTRTKSGVSGFNPTALANARWELGTTRSGWATATVRLYYTDAMIAGLTEANLVIYRAASLAGPWTPLTTTVTANRNYATATTSSLGHFVLATSAPDGAAPTAGIVLSDSTTTDLDAVRFAVTFNEPVAPTFTSADVTVTGSLSGGTVVGVGGTDPNYIVTVRAVNPDANGTLGITLGTGVTDAVGNAYGGGVSATYTIANFGRADINKDSVVNVADVTALANHIVNGDPLP